MSCTFGIKRHHNHNLLNGLLIKSHQQFLSVHDMCIGKLFESCSDVKVQGGTFVHRHCEASLKPIGYTVQIDFELSRVKVYGIYYFGLDATHNATKYNVKVCPPVVIDCFGLHENNRLSTFDTEADELINHALKNLSLNNVGAVVDVECATGLDIPLQYSSIVKTHDTWHFCRDILSAGLGLCDNYSNFKQKCNKPIYTNFGTTMLLDIFFIKFVCRIYYLSKTI